MGSRSVAKVGDNDQYLSTGLVSNHSAVVSTPSSTSQHRGGAATTPSGPRPHSPQAGLYVTRKEEQEVPLVSEPGPRRHGCWQRLFLRHHNERFADQAEAVARTAVWVALLAAPHVLPEGTVRQADEYVAKGYIGRASILVFLLVADQTAGQTLGNAVSSLAGSVLCVLSLAGMNKVLPHGLTEGSPWLHTSGAFVFGAFFTLAVLWLNVGMHARVLCLATFARGFMVFVNPFADSCGGDESCRPRTDELIQVAIACGLALASNVLPTPAFALRKARVDVREATLSLTRAWFQVAAHFCGTQAQDYQQEKLLADLHKMTAALEALDGHLLNSWHEFGWFRSVRNIRECIARLRRTQQESADRLFCSWNTCLQETFGALHDEMMPRLWPHVQKVVGETSGLLSHCTEVSCGGRVYDAEEPPLRDSAERTRQAVGTLTAKFREMKASVGIEGVYEELLDEHNFVVQICAYGRIVSDLAEDLLAQKGQTKPLPAAEAPPSVFDRTALTDRQHLGFVVRSFVALSLAFLFGYLGYSKTMLTYDAGPAATVALLLRRSVGSSSARNGARMRAVVGGALFGHVVYAVAGWCTTWGYVATFCALLYWVMAALLHPEESGLPVPGATAAGASAGVLSAYFAADGLTNRCTTQVFTVADVFGRSYYGAVGALAGAALVCVVDGLLSPASASQHAVRSLGHAFGTLAESLTDVLDPRVSRTKPRANELTQRINTAEIVGRQADVEPRHWRLPWRGQLFGDAVQSAARLRMSLAGMEFTCAEGGRFGAGKTEKLRRFTSLPSFTPLRKVALEKMEHIAGLLEAALAQETGDTMRALASPQLKRNFVGEFVQNMRAFIVEVNRLPEVAQDKFAGSSLENDVASQACLMLSCLASVVAEAQALQNSLLMRAY